MVTQRDIKRPAHRLQGGYTEGYTCMHKHKTVKTQYSFLICRENIILVIRDSRSPSVILNIND